MLYCTRTQRVFFDTVFCYIFDLVSVNLKRNPVHFYLNIFVVLHFVFSSTAFIRFGFSYVCYVLKSIN